MDLLFARPCNAHLLYLMRWLFQAYWKNICLLRKHGLSDVPQVQSGIETKKEKKRRLSWKCEFNFTVSTQRRSKVSAAKLCVPSTLSLAKWPIKSWTFCLRGPLIHIYCIYWNRSYRHIGKSLICVNDTAWSGAPCCLWSRPFPSLVKSHYKSLSPQWSAITISWDRAKVTSVLWNRSLELPLKVDGGSACHGRGWAALCCRW